MGILQKIFNKSSASPAIDTKHENGVAIDKKSYSVPYYLLGDVAPGTLQDYLLNGVNRIRPRVAADIYRTSSAIGIAVDTIADEVEQITPVLKIGDEYIDNHEVLGLLDMPNPYEHRTQLVGQIARDWLLNHNVYLTMVGNIRSAPIAIYNSSPRHVSATEGFNTYPSAYNITEGAVTGNFRLDQRGRQKVRYLDGNLKEVAHIRGYSSRSDYLYGDSPLESILIEVRQHILSGTHNLCLLRNGGRLSLIAIFRDRLNTDELAERREWLNEQLAGAHNAGRIATISSDDLELEEVGKTNKDMDFGRLDEVVFKIAMIRYKIPLPIVTNEASTFNNLETAVFHLYDRSVLPTYSYIMDGVSRALLPRFGLDPRQAKITFNPESIPALVDRTLEQLLKRKTLGVETINELRAHLPNREPISGPGGDTVYQPATLVPVGDDLFTDDNTNSAEEQARRRQAEEDNADNE